MPKIPSVENCTAKPGYITNRNCPFYVAKTMILNYQNEANILDTNLYILTESGSNFVLKGTMKCDLRCNLSFATTTFQLFVREKIQIVR